MDQNYRTVGSIIVVVCLSFSAVLCVGLGVAFLSSYPHELWWLGVALAGAGILLILGSIQNPRSWRRENKASEVLVQHLNHLPQKVLTAEDRIDAKLYEPKATDVLASWVYSAGEWQQFMHWERRERRLNVLIESVWIIVLGTFLLTIFKGVSIFMALLICSSFAVFYAVVKYVLTINSIERSRNCLPEVIITKEAALVNGKLNRFYGENLWLGKVDIKETSTANILEITYWWNTRKGKTFDELRVPIPKGKLREAVAVQQALTNGI